MDEFLGPATYVRPIGALEQAPALERTPIGEEISAYSFKSPQEVVDELYENERIKALMLYLACHWGLEHDGAGVGYLIPLLLNRAVNSRLCVGGSHRLSNAICRVIQEPGGGHLRGSVRIKRIIVEDGRATGVELENGTVYEADKAVVSSIDPHQTFLELVGEDNLPEEFVEKIKMWQWEKSSLCSLHLALEEPPDFTSATDNPDVNKGLMYIMGVDTPDDLIRHWQEIDRGEVSSTVVCDSVFPTLHDSSQAPAGRHTCSMHEMAPYNLKEGAERWWDRKLREEHEAQFLATLQKFSPNLTKDKVLWTYFVTPLDFSHKFLNMVEGSYKQGAYLPLQMGFLRPNEECSEYATPVKGLYICGASCHSGGLVTFGPGYNAVNRIAEDLGIEKWWQEPELVREAKRKGYFGEEYG
jgi:phytoene dehydrogenase-like protein